MHVFGNGARSQNIDFEVHQTEVGSHVWGQNGQGKKLTILQCLLPSL